MTTDDLIYMIGKLTIEKEMLLRVNEEQAARILALEQANDTQAKTPEKE